MRAGSVALAAVAATVAALAGCSDDGSAGDRQAFCEAVESLAADDPFADLEVASPREMRSAFAELRDGADAIEDSAPPEASVPASDYLAAVDELMDQLSGAGYDPRSLDPLEYGRAVEDYTEAATSVTNAANATCE